MFSANISEPYEPKEKKALNHQFSPDCVNNILALCFWETRTMMKHLW